MKKLLLTAAFLSIASVSYAQNPNVACSDATATNCTVKKNASFQVTADPYTDPLSTKMRLYVDGVKTFEVSVVGTLTPLFTFASGLSVVGDHTLYMEAVGNCIDAQGVSTECATAGLNSITVHLVTGNVTAPKNVRIVK